MTHDYSRGLFLAIVEKYQESRKSMLERDPNTGEEEIAKRYFDGLTNMIGVARIKLKEQNEERGKWMDNMKMFTDRIVRFEPLNTLFQDYSEDRIDYAKANMVLDDLELKIKNWIGENFPSLTADDKK